MNQETLAKLYVAAIERCEKGKAWEFERHFAEIIIGKCMQIAKEESYNDHKDINDSIRYYFGIDKKEAEPVKHSDGTLVNFTVKGFRCRCKDCGCNVFHKPDKTNLNLYQCNACNQQYEAEDNV